MNGERQGIVGASIADRYLCSERIAVGGMGELYRATDTTLKRDVVVKLIKNDKEGDSSINRFFREARILSSLQHPNIVTIHDFGHWRGMPFIVMEYLVGSSLDRLISSQSPLSSERIVEILSQVMDGLEAAHQQSVIHRDLKPSNIFCARGTGVREIVKLLDFGLAMSLFQDRDQRITMSGEILGTPFYVSPEQIMRKSVLTPRSDIYSLGVVLFEMLYGSVPFAGPATMEILLGHLYQPPPPIETATSSDPMMQRLITLCRICLRKNPDDRFSSIADMRKVLGDEQRGSERAEDHSLDSRESRFKHYFKASMTEIFHPTKPDITLSDRRILVIEDSTTSVDRSIVPLLDSFRIPFSVITTDDWNSTSEKPQLPGIILNCNPEKTLSVVRALRQLDRMQIHLVVCGSDDDMDYIADVIEAGADDFCSYPFEPNDLVQKLIQMGTTLGHPDPDRKQEIQ